MTKKKIVPLVLILVGIAFLLGAIISWLDNLTASEPVGLGKWIFDILVALIGASSGIKGYLDWNKKETPSQVTNITAQDNAQIATGEQGRNIQAKEYKEQNIQNYYEASYLPKSSENLGDIPPVKVARYIHRGEIEENVRNLLRKGGVGAIVGLHGPGGLGKTELAKHATEDLKSQYENVLWVNINEKTVQEVVVGMLLQCGVQVQPGASYAVQRNELRSWLQNHQLLIIFDDLRENALNDLADILPPKPCSALITSRIQDIAAIPITFPLDVMSKPQALELFRAVLGDETAAAERETLERLAERCKYNPLALEIAAHRILQMKGFDTPAKLYLNKVEKRFEELYAAGDERWNMTAVFDLSYFDLKETDRSRFHKLAAFQNTGFAPDAAAYIWGMEQVDADRIITRFINLSLLKLVPGSIERYCLHDLLDEYAALKLSQSGEETRARNDIAKWLADLFDEHFTEDQTTAPQVKLELDNLERSAEWLISQKDGKMDLRTLQGQRAIGLWS